MNRGLGIASLVMAWGAVAAAQQPVGYADAYLGPASIGSGEPLFRYDDQERWKHGWVRAMPYYEGFHSFRPYNYHHVFSQSQTASGWGMPAVMPYSQQFWHRYEKMADLTNGDHSPVAPYERPPQEWDHYPKPLRPSDDSASSYPTIVPNSWTQPSRQDVQPVVTAPAVQPAYQARPQSRQNSRGPYLPAPY